MAKTTESIIEQNALQTLHNLGYQTAYGPDIAHGGKAPERDPAADYKDVVLLSRLRSSLERINPNLPEEALSQAISKVTQAQSPSLIENNRAFHKMLTDGVDVSWRGTYGEKHGQVQLLDLEDTNNNDCLALNQFIVVEKRRDHYRKLDLVLFINGLPLVVMELKNSADEKATIFAAYRQLQTYKADIPSLFIYNALLVISDDMRARFGTLTSGWDRFMPWRTIDGDDLYREPGDEKQSEGLVRPGLDTLLKGLFDPKRLLDYCLNTITFEHDGGDTSTIAKKAAAYYQYHAVNKAVEYTLSACGIKAPKGLSYARFRQAEQGDPFAVHEEQAPYGSKRRFGDQRIGVVWHTQGSGKSLSMAFYASKIMRHPYMKNPTLLVITDRNDLDEQLFTTFSNNADLLRQTPVQADNRKELRKLLRVSSGGIVFSTLQKFLPERGRDFPLLSERRNIVVIADEAHRSQYAFIDGFARHLRDALPNASFIGFTGTPIESDDKSTTAVFGEIIDRYDIRRAVEDGATVPIYYESRLARIELDEAEKPSIDPEFEQITEAEEEEGRKQRLRSKWASLEALVGSEKRIGLVAADIVEHFEQRQETLRGKGLIVCMSRRLCVELYQAIVKLRPDWHRKEESKGRIKIVMSGSASDQLAWQAHIRSKSAREAMAKRYKNPEDELELVIVRDMWLTGFDCPSLHTLYVDKPMSGHNLMQAITRVNRVFHDKPGGLVVDYLGLADALKRALVHYTASGGKGQVAIDQEEAVPVMLEKYEIVRDLFHGFDYTRIVEARRQHHHDNSDVSPAMDFIASSEEGKKRYLTATLALTKAFALAVPHPKALAIRDELQLFQEIRANIVKITSSDKEASAQSTDTAIRQLVSRAIASSEIVDIFAAVGLDKPEISILSDEFLEEMRQLPQRNLAFELLKKLINDEIKTRMSKNIVQARSFTKMLEQAIRKYQNRAIETAQVIEELIELAKEMRAAQKRGEQLGLNDDEIAFYDALGVNDSAVQVLGDPTLKAIAQELAVSVKSNYSIDWTKRENAQAKIKTGVKRILRKYGYPPDKQEQATQLVLKQASLTCKEYAAGSH